MRTRLKNCWQVGKSSNGEPAQPHLEKVHLRISGKGIPKVNLHAGVEVKLQGLGIFEEDGILFRVKVDWDTGEDWVVLFDRDVS